MLRMKPMPLSMAHRPSVILLLPMHPPHPLLHPCRVSPHPRHSLSIFLPLVFGLAVPSAWNSLPTGSHCKLIPTKGSHTRFLLSDNFPH